MDTRELEQLWDLLIDKLEAIPLIIATRLGPWLTPLVPAYFVHRAMVDRLNTPTGWAWVAAVALAYSLFLNVYFISDRLLLSAIQREGQGYIYILKREDGIYKVGRAGNVQARILQHEKDYGKRFTLLKSWKVDDPSVIEKRLLDLSKKYEYVEENRQELRSMNLLQLIGFAIKAQWIVK